MRTNTVIIALVALALWMVSTRESYTIDVNSGMPVFNSPSELVAVAVSETNRLAKSYGNTSPKSAQVHYQAGTFTIYTHLGTSGVWSGKYSGSIARMGADMKTILSKLKRARYGVETSFAHL